VKAASCGNLFHLAFGPIDSGSLAKLAASASSRVSSFVVDRRFPVAERKLLNTVRNPWASPKVRRNNDLCYPKWKLGRARPGTMLVMFFGSGLPLSSSPLSPFICSIFVEFSPCASLSSPNMLNRCWEAEEELLASPHADLAAKVDVLAERAKLGCDMAEQLEAISSKG
jgi:hypothetical protein